MAYDRKCKKWCNQLRIFENFLKEYGACGHVWIAWTLMIKRFSNDSRKTNGKVISPTYHNSSKQRSEPIRIPSIYL